MNNTALIVFVKNPELGRCKTRLAASIGDASALEVYKVLLTHTLNVSLAVDLSRHLFYDEFIPEKDMWPHQKFNKNLQVRGDLGDRMKAAFRLALSNQKSAIIIGSDCPEISPDIIKNAINALQNKDIVIGPTLDGGYYLLGMKKCHDFLFEDIDWSTEKVFSQTCEKAESNALSVTVVEKLSDLDNIDDLNNFPHIKSQIIGL